jgi:hypothetical protein
MGELTLEVEHTRGGKWHPNPYTNVHQEGEAVVLERTNAEATMNVTAINMCKDLSYWLDIEVFFVRAQKVRRSPVKMMGKEIEQYKKMTHNEKNQTHPAEHIKTIKGRLNQEMDAIVMEIITGPESETDGIFLEWSKFDERTKANQKNNEPNNDKVLFKEQVKTILLRSTSGGWHKPATEVLYEYLYEYLVDLKRSLREATNTLRIIRMKGSNRTVIDLIGHMYELKKSKDKLISCMINTILDAGIVKSFKIKVITT